MKISHDIWLWPSFQGQTEKSQFQSSITSLLLLLEQKIVLTGYRKSYPNNKKMCSYLTFDLNSRSNQGLMLISDLKCNLKNVVTVNLIFFMIDHHNPCKKKNSCSIFDRDLHFKVKFRPKSSKNDQTNSFWPTHTFMCLFCIYLLYVFMILSFCRMTIPKC
jgi:hypothetical protein